MATSSLVCILVPATTDSNNQRANSDNQKNTIRIKSKQTRAQTRKKKKKIRSTTNRDRSPRTIHRRSSSRAGTYSPRAAPFAKRLPRNPNSTAHGHRRKRHKKEPNEHRPKSSLNRRLRAVPTERRHGRSSEQEPERRSA